MNELMSVFGVRQEEGLLACAFEREGWCQPDLWHDASVRSGWIQGLLNMLSHRKALEFICGNGKHRLSFKMTK